MTEKQAKTIFERYNPAHAVTRCPNGRSPVRKLLDSYAKAAVNLYGAIPRAELVDIFNRQNIVRTNADEVFALLLPLVLKNKWYCFYKDYIVHYWAMDDFEYADFWLHEQGSKPRYIPEKDELLKYEDQHYTCVTQAFFWSKVLEFIDEAWPENPQRYHFYSDLKENAAFGANIKVAIDLLGEYGLVLSDEKDVQRFIGLYMEACNNTRIWANKGYSPIELISILDSQRPKNASREIHVQPRVKIGANDPCPCGSGKKFKKCCRLIEEAKTAQLTRGECMLFYETWYGLMGFINEREKVINAVIKPVYPNRVGDEQMFKIREVFWENPAVINDYLDATSLREDKVKLLESWRDHHKKGMFVLVDYKPEYAIAIGSNEEKEDRLYGIKGISRSLADAMQRELPIQFETVLLPFGDKIIYDSFLQSMPIGFAEGAKNMFREMYDKALEHGIITVLGG